MPHSPYLFAQEYSTKGGTIQETTTHPNVAYRSLLCVHIGSVLVCTILAFIHLLQLFACLLPSSHSEFLEEDIKSLIMNISYICLPSTILLIRELPLLHPMCFY